MENRICTVELNDYKMASWHLKGLSEEFMGEELAVAGSPTDARAFEFSTPENLARFESALKVYLKK